MIQPISGKGVSRANAICDDCGREETVACDYARGSGNDWRPNEGQITKKLIGQGWAVVKGALHCPACEGKRKIQQKKLVPTEVESWDPLEDPTPEIAMKAKSLAATVTTIREPTREEKRQIMGLLEVSYDADAGRYKGADTDQTVAAAIGGGVMSGWVAEIREEFFGPDGGNGEMDALLAEMRAWVKEKDGELLELNHLASVVGQTIKSYEEKAKQVDAFVKRLDAIRTAVGPKAVRA